MENIKISNPEDLERKISQIKDDGYKSLHIIADFDKTLTKAFVKGQKTHTSIAQIREGNYLTSDYPAKAHALFNKYHPYEVSIDITKEERNAKMVEWWATHLELIIKSGMNRGIVEDIIKRKKIKLREGTLKLLNILSQNNIPLLIFSAGVGNIIEECLKAENVLYKNIHIISNTFEYDNYGKVIGYKSKMIIHSFNKNEVEIVGTPYAKLIEGKRNVILLGDSLGDLGMTEGLKHNNIINIGFLNEEVKKLFSEYSKQYDVVILNDSSMDYVNNLVNRILE